MDVVLRGVTKRYGDIVAVDGVDLRFDGVTVIVGPSGSGKSTLLNLIAGLLTPDEGAIYFAERDVTTVPPEERGIGYVFQSYALFPHLTVAENIEFGLIRSPLPKGERVAEMMRAFRIERFATRRPGELSGGERQRVALARALARDPRVLLLDEPLAALDAQLRETLRHELARLFRAESRTVLYVTHDRAEAMAIADRIVVMRGGRIEQVGTPAEIYLKPANRFVAAFFGDANFVQAKVDESGTLAIASIGALSLPGRMEPGQQIELLIRPEGFVQSGGMAAALHITHAAFLGNRWRVEGSDACGNAFVIELPPGARVAAGETIDVAVRGDAVHILDA
jgi:ABC-type Fe3+/spermidine/putrescine transport system ATPase subunit